MVLIWESVIELQIYLWIPSFIAGDTIRIFRRSRSGRPTSAGTSSTSATSESQDPNDKLLRTEDLPAPDTGAGAREASSNVTTTNVFHDTLSAMAKTIVEMAQMKTI